MKQAVGIASGLLLLLCSYAYADSPRPSNGPVISPSIAPQYTHPHERISIEPGRKLNLFCMGSGRHTVIFDSGLSDWSVIWALVQPTIAKQARACTYDRAGLGYSDPSDEPSAPMAVVEDLQKLIHSAKISLPVVLVGHSLGGFNAKLYAALYPKEVTGLVLVDPTEERYFARSRTAIRAKFGASVTAQHQLDHHASSTISRLNRCASASQAHDLDPKYRFYNDCVDPGWLAFGPVIQGEWSKIEVRHSYQEAQASELANSVLGDSWADDAYAMLFSGRPFGSKPVIVLTAGSYDKNDPFQAADVAARSLLHGQTAALSTHGVHRIVPRAHHYIQMDRPQAVIDAISEVLREVGAK